MLTTPIRLFFLIFILIPAFYFSDVRANSEDLYSFSSEQAQSRFHLFVDEVRCVSCQNQTIAESQASLAMDLKRKIAMMIEEGKSDTEIKQFLIKRYGEFILLTPPMNKLTWLLWISPFFLLITALGVLLVVCRQQQ